MGLLVAMQRNKNIASDRLDGMLLTELASKYDLSRGRISVILNQQGVILTSIRLREQMERIKANA